MRGSLPCFWFLPCYCFPLSVEEQHWQDISDKQFVSDPLLRPAQHLPHLKNTDPNMTSQECRHMCACKKKKKKKESVCLHLSDHCQVSPPPTQECERFLRMLKELHFFMLLHLCFTQFQRNGALYLIHTLYYYQPVMSYYREKSLQKRSYGFVVLLYTGEKYGQK